MSKKPIAKDSMVIRVWGPYACFSRPEFSERVSNEIITVSAAKGILESIYWHPGVSYTIETIYVRKPIRYIPFKRNEISDVISIKNVLATINSNSNATLKLNRNASNQTQQRQSLILNDVEYYIQFHMNYKKIKGGEDDCYAKHLGIFQRRLKKGQTSSQPYLGCKEFIAFVEPSDIDSIPECPEELKGERNLGWVTMDIGYGGYLKEYRYASERIPCLIYVTLRDGIFKVPDNRHV